jgi:DNA-binding MarR family transcriptional regulator
LIQTLVNGLLEQGLVAQVENPAHRRSQLVSLTPDGKAMIDRMRRRERRFFESRAITVSTTRITAATRTLRAIRNELEGDE